MTDRKSSPKAVPYVLIVGATASGKSALALEIAKELGGEIINCDSIQLYRDFNIGAAKPSLTDQKSVPHHLFDVLDCEQEYDAAQYAVVAKERLVEIDKKGKAPVVVGGTGLYARALIGSQFHDLPHDPTLRKKIQNMETEDVRKQLQQIDPDRLACIHPHDRFRIDRSLEIALLSGKTFADLTAETSALQPTPPTLSVYCDIDKAVLEKRILLRTDKMLEHGLVDEVKNLLHSGKKRTSKPFQSIGYKETLDYLDGIISSKEELRQRIVIATRQYAKRQRTWFKKMKHDLIITDTDHASDTRKVCHEFRAKCPRQ